MADGKIYITISDSRGGSGAGVSSDADGASAGNKKEKSIGKFVQKRFFDLVESEAKQVVNFSIGNIGDFYGNYQTQNDIQSAMRGVNFIINLATSAGGAFVTFGGGVQGAIAAAVAVAATTISTGVNLGMEIQKDKFNNRRINKNIEIMRQRIGLEGLTDGSRTGGY